MKRFLFLASLCIIAIALLACGGTGAINTGTTSTSKTPTPQQQQHFKPGDTVTVGGTWQIVVDAPSTSTGEQFFTPKEGNIYLLIPVSFKNVTDKEQQLYGYADWKLKDTAGQKYEPAFISASSAPDGKIEAGGPAKGTLTYEVPTVTKEFRFAFQISMFSSGQTIWDLSLP